MIPAAFDYARPSTLDEALRLLEKHGDDAKLLAGGHSLLPAMKLRLSQPRVLIDIGRLEELNGIRDEGSILVLGALTTHHAIESSEILRSRCPLLPEVAGCIGDPQVRNRGTIGGSIAHADPAADWPAAILALDAVVEVAGLGGRRTIKAAELFTDLMQTSVQPTEVITRILVPPTRPSVAYEKFAQKASGFAIAGAAVVRDANDVRVAITGVAPKAYRAEAVEAALAGAALTPSVVRAAAEHAADGVEPLGDIHASAEFRAQLAKVLTRRALERVVT